MMSKNVCLGDKNLSLLIKIHLGIKPIKGGSPPNESREVNRKRF
jgi:hypothetical protein